VEGLEFDGTLCPPVLSKSRVYTRFHSVLNLLIVFNVRYFEDFALVGEMFEDIAREHFSLQRKVFKMTHINKLKLIGS
jgi:hypothetical protein